MQAFRRALCTTLWMSAGSHDAVRASAVILRCGQRCGAGRDAKAPRLSGGAARANTMGPSIADSSRSRRRAKLRHVDRTAPRSGRRSDVASRGSQSVLPRMDHEAFSVGHPRRVDSRGKRSSRGSDRCDKSARQRSSSAEGPLARGRFAPRAGLRLVVSSARQRTGVDLEPATTRTPVPACPRPESQKVGGVLPSVEELELCGQMADALDRARRGSADHRPGLSHRLWTALTSSRPPAHAAPPPWLSPANCLAMCRV